MPAYNQPSVFAVINNSSDGNPEMLMSHKKAEQKVQELGEGVNVQLSAKETCNDTTVKA